jgi:predicted nuclease with RNAse H fold/dephospho-CoA kinase
MLASRGVTEALAAERGSVRAGHLSQGSLVARGYSAVRRPHWPVPALDATASTNDSLLPFASTNFDNSPCQVRGGLRVRPPRRLKPGEVVEGLSTALEDPHRVLFLDVETTGLSRYYDDITLVGWLLDGVYRVYVAGDDPGLLLSSLRDASALVTFNGTLFDLGFLEKAFTGLVLPSVHADLRFLGRRVGLIGGQKAIEKKLGILVRAGIEDVDGAEAVLLWHRYLRGDEHSLRRLIEYNRCDVIAMRNILDYILGHLIAEPTFWYSAPHFSLVPCKVSGWATPEANLPCAGRLRRAANTFQSLLGGSPAEDPTVVGIDLTSSGSKPSGWCVLRGAFAETAMIGSDDEIIKRTLSTGPALVSIDSPLSIPYGRSRVEDDDPTRSEFGIMRRCERELKRRGINVYPCLLPSMQGLTKRGMGLAAQFRDFGIPVIESYPGAAQDIMGIPRKGAGEEFLRQGLSDFGILGRFASEAVRHDELDAITSALVGSFFLAGIYEALGGPSEDPLIIPDLHAMPGPIVIGISGRICAGKTTLARLLERKGFAYTRFSLVVDEEIVARGELPNRESRQRIGLEIHRMKGQRWLCERVLGRVREQAFIVVDGLRFREDHAFLTERFSSRFAHLHVIAGRDLRRERYQEAYPGDDSFDQADGDLVEGEVDDLARLAGLTIDNSSTVDDLERAVVKIVETLADKGNVTCLFQ